VINRIREDPNRVNVTPPLNLPDPKDAPFFLCSEEGNAELHCHLNPKDLPQDLLRAKIISPKLWRVASLRSLMNLRAIQTDD